MKEITVAAMITNHSHPECLRIVPIIVINRKEKPNQPGQLRSNVKVVLVAD
jgi:hypothetical protein